MYLEFKPYLGNKIKKKRICVSVCQFVFTIIKKIYRRNLSRKTCLSFKSLRHKQHFSKKKRISLYNHNKFLKDFFQSIPDNFCLFSRISNLYLKRKLCVVGVMISGVFFWWVCVRLFRIFSKYITHLPYKYVFFKS